MNERDAVFGQILTPGERVIWQGRPIPGRALITPADGFMIPFSVIWLGVAIIWLAGVAPRSEVRDILDAWGVPFVIVGAYLVAGRFFLRYRLAQKSRYAVTDRRVLIRHGLLRPVTTSLDLRSIPFIQVKAQRDGVGDVTFARSLDGLTATAQVFPWTSGAFMGRFRAVADVRRVLALIESARKAAA